MFTAAVAGFSVAIDWAYYAAGLVLLAALMHALWNTILKIKGERAMVIFLITGGATLGGAVAALYLPAPAPASWPYLLQSSLLHCGYLYTLSAAYQRAELGVVYPIARGGAPAIVLLLSLLFFDEALQTTQVIAICVLAFGIVTLAWEPLQRKSEWAGPVYAVLTACFIAGYSINDGKGARVAGNPHSYAAWLFVCQFLPVAAFVIAKYRQQLKPMIRRNWRLGLLGGVLSLISYWLVIWAMTILSVPVAVALREVSVLFAMLIGVLFLGEPWSRYRATAVALVLGGLALLRL